VQSPQVDGLPTSVCQHELSTATLRAQLRLTGRSRICNNLAGSAAPDELDSATSSGWSVTVTGRAVLVTDPEAAARYRASR
jgi:hypothetical protein